MTDDKMKLLTLDGWAAFNLDKWCKGVVMNLSSAAERKRKMAVRRARVEQEMEGRGGRWRKIWGRI